MNDIYPYEVPEGVHPYAWMFLGFGLSGEQTDELARHVFDRLGARWSGVEQKPVTVRFAVDFPLDAGEDYQKVSVGQSFSEAVSPDSGARVASGFLPPGIVLERHTGVLVGEFTKPGLYTVEIARGAEVKWDALGTRGGPESVGEWIPVGEKRAVVQQDLSGHKPTLDDMTDEEKAQALAGLLAWEASKAAEAKNGY